jgi:hypothetical protein
VNALRAAWLLTAFVIVAGIVGWIVSGRAVFAVFILLGVLTAAGAVVAFRSPQPPAPKEGPTP